MLRKLFWAPVAAAALLIPAASVSAEDFPGLDQGTWELTLSGSGASNQDVNAGNAALQGSIGYYLLDQLEIQGRQTVSYNDSDTGGTNVTASSAVALDYHFDLDRFQPFIGVGVGYAYGKDANDTGFAGPEAGLKYFVKNDVFLYGLVQYQFFFDSADEADNNFDDGSFLYGVGIGFTF